MEAIAVSELSGAAGAVDASGVEIVTAGFVELGVAANNGLRFASDVAVGAEIAVTLKEPFKLPTVTA